MIHTLTGVLTVDPERGVIYFCSEESKAITCLRFAGLKSQLEDRFNNPVDLRLGQLDIHHKLNTLYWNWHEINEVCDPIERKPA